MKRRGQQRDPGGEWKKNNHNPPPFNHLRNQLIDWIGFPLISEVARRGSSGVHLL